MADSDDFVSPERPPSVASNSSMVLRSQCRFTRSGLPCPVQTNKYTKGRRSSRRSANANSFHHQSNSSTTGNMTENGFMRINETEFSDDDFTSFNLHHHGHSHGDGLHHLHHSHHHHHHDFDDDEHDRESVITPSITDSDIERLRDIGDLDEEEEIRRNVNHVHHIVNRVRRRGNANKSSNIATTTKETTSDHVHVQKSRPKINKKYLWILLALVALIIAIYLLFPAMLRLNFWPFSSSSSSHLKQFDPSTSEQLASHQMYMQSLEALSNEFQSVTKGMNEHIQSMRTELSSTYDEKLQSLMQEHERLSALIEAKLKEPCCKGSSLDESTVRRFIGEAIAKYDSDKTGLADYALESSGGTIVNTRCSETYLPTASEYRIMGIPVWRTSNSPRTVIQPGSAPGECWAFHGSEGFLVVKLARKVVPTSFTYEHAPKTILFDGAIETSPKDFRVYGLENETDTKGELLGHYVYDMNGEPLQTFPIQNPNSVSFEYIEFRILSNNGNPNYTCLYRFRVHGRIAF